MSTLDDVKSSLAGALQTIPGLNVLPRLVQVQPPAAIIELDRVEYHDASMGEPAWSFNITVLASGSDLEAQQVQLDSYLDPSGAASVREAIEDSFDLGDAHVRSASGYQTYDFGGETYLGVRFQVEVRP